MNTNKIDNSNYQNDNINYQNIEVDIIDILEYKLTELKTAINSKANYFYCNIAFNISDAIYDTTKKTYSWYLTNSPNKIANTINVNQNMKNIIGVKISPINLDINYNTYNTTTLGYLGPNIISHYLVMIDEFRGQAYDYFGEKFHFTGVAVDSDYAYSTDYLGNPIEIPPASGFLYGYPLIRKITFSGESDGVFMFNTPYTSISSITIKVFDAWSNTFILPPSCEIALQLIYLENE